MGDFEALVLPRSDTPVRLVFVHGIHQEDKTSLTLQETWEDALLSTWAAAGLEKPDYTLEMPYYVRDNPHAIAEYIGHATVAERIHVALSGS